MAPVNILRLQYWEVASILEEKKKQTLKKYMRLRYHDGCINRSSPFRSTRCGEDVAAGAPTELGTTSDNAGES